MANKQISINQWESLLNKQTTTIPLVEGDEESPLIEIKHTLSLDEMIKFVHTVAYGCFVVAPKQADGSPAPQPFEPAEGDIVCMPEIKDFLTRRQVLSQYANFRMPNDLGKQYELIFNTPVFHRVINCIDMEQVNDMLRSIDVTINNIQRGTQSVGKVLKTGLDSLMSTMDGLSDIDPEAIKLAQGSIDQLVAQSTPDKVMEAVVSKQTNPHGLKEVTVE